MSSEIGESTSTPFKLQRRNILVLSVVLIVAVIPNTIHLGVFDIEAHPPFTIAMIVWIIWGYWLWRYYTAYRELEDTGIMRIYEGTLFEKVRPVATRMLETDSGAKQIVNTLLKESKADTYAVFDHRHADRYPGRWRWKLILKISVPMNADRDSWRGLDPPIGVELGVLPLLWARTRTWTSVFLNTSLFSEYLLPFVIAIAAGALGIYRLIC